MKKIIALVTSLVMLASFTGCSSDSANTDAAETTASSVSETAAVEETTAETTEAPEETTVETTTEAVEETAAEELPAMTAEELQAIVDSKSDGLWAVDVSNKINQWENNVDMRMSYEQDGVSMLISMHSLENKFSLLTDIPGMFTMEILCDGTATYLLDSASSTYCKDTSGTYTNESEIDSYLISDKDAESFSGCGVEEVNGTPYIYEEYTVDDTTLRYYFDGYGNVRYVGSNAEGQQIYMDFIVEFYDERDESRFVLPEGYSEISEEEYAEKLLAAMFSSLESSLETSAEAE